MSGGAADRIRADVLRATESFYGPHRSERPSDLRGRSAVCPFCPGNEGMTGPALTPGDAANWESRVVANAYPAVVEPDGRHEVIVETRSHVAPWTTIEVAALERIFGLYADREADGYNDGYAYVAVFKNAGAAAGASLTHPHAQAVALRAIPRSIAARLERLPLHCPTCALLAAGSERIVTRGPHIVTYVPDGSRTAFEMRIAPVEHVVRFSQATAETLEHVARTVADCVKRLAVVLGEEPAFNMVVQSAPRDARAEEKQHWELELIPRNESFGGFELGTGGFLVSRLPEDAARILRACGDGAHG